MTITWKPAAVVVCLVLLSGCGSTTAAGKPKATPTATSSVTTSPTAAGRTPAARAPKGMRLVTAPKSGLRLAVPDAWVAINAKSLTDPSARARLTRAAKAMSLTLEQLEQLMERADLVVTSVGGQGNLNVAQVSALAEVPTEAFIRASFQSLNAVVTGVQDVDTPLGQGREAEYDLDVGRLAVHGAGLFVMLDSGVVNLTVTTADRTAARTLLDRIIPTLRQAG